MSVKEKIFKKIKQMTRKPVRKITTPIRWGIIGTGYMANTFSEAIDGNAEGIVAAVASRNIDKAEQFSKKHGNAKAYGSYEDMLRDTNAELDIVYIATPNSEHYHNIKSCLMAGKNVLCEKPITEKLSELEELIELAKANNCFLMEGMWMKCLPTFQKARMWLKEGRIGKLDLVKVDFYKHAIINTDYTIYNKDKGGGVLKDYGVYAIAFASGFMGDIDETESHTRISSYEIDSDWQIFLRSKEVQAFVNISSDFSGTSRAVLLGDKGSIEWNTQFNRTNEITLYNRDGSVSEKFRAEYTFDGFEYEVNEVQNCIKNAKKQSNLVSLEDSLKTLKIIDKLLHF